MWRTVTSAGRSQRAAARSAEQGPDHERAGDEHAGDHEDEVAPVLHATRSGFMPIAVP